MKAWCWMLLFFLKGISVPAQLPPYQNLVMEGGGIRGIAYIGALEVLDSAGVLQGIQRYGGSSAGAIQAMLLALGYTPAEIKEKLAGTSFSQFNDGSFLGLPGAIRLGRRMGWYKGEKLTRWLEQLVAAKTGDPNTSFAMLQRMGRPGLYITATNLTRQHAMVFCAEHFPNMRIADAVRISAAIPLYFLPVWIDGAGTCFPTDDGSGNRSLVVDGGLMSNYPIHLFDSVRFLPAGLQTPDGKNPYTIGLQLEEPELMHQPDGQIRVPVEDPGSYLKAIYKLLVDKPLPDPQRTVVISNLALNPRIRRLPGHTIARLLQSGREGARSFLQQTAASAATH